MHYGSTPTTAPLTPTAATAIFKEDYDRAIADYTRAIRCEPPQPPEFLAMTYTNRGAAHSCRSDYDQAIADHTEAIRLHPHFAGAAGWLVEDQAGVVVAVGVLVPVEEVVLRVDAQ
jgi:tetratricopeptide (TPR) repeat protein